MRAAGAPHDAEAVVLGHGRLEHGEARLEERDVDALASPAAECVAPVEGGEDPLNGPHPGEGVAERDVETRRGLVPGAGGFPEPPPRPPPPWATAPALAGSSR